MPVANGGAPQAGEASGLGPEAAVLGEVYSTSTGEQLVLGLPEQAADSSHLKDESSEEFTPHKRYSSHPHNIEEAEDLLETYFMRVGIPPCPPCPMNPKTRNHNCALVPLCPGWCMGFCRRSEGAVQPAEVQCMSACSPEVVASLQCVLMGGTE